jgi:t-SNARE complex subunit (syntaxin)
LVPEVRMTVEEYLDLLEKTASNVKRVGRAARTIQKETRPARRKAGKAVKGMAAALKKANAKARKKNGSFKKGYDQARVMRMAHQMRRRAL